MVRPFYWMEKMRRDDRLNHPASAGHLDVDCSFLVYEISMILILASYLILANKMCAVAETSAERILEKEDRELLFRKSRSSRWKSIIALKRTASKVLKVVNLEVLRSSTVIITTFSHLRETQAMNPRILMKFLFVA